MRIPFEELKSTDLFTGAVYATNGNRNLSGEVLSKLMAVENQSGFRKRWRIDKPSLAYIVLESTGKEADWPDSNNLERRHVIYYGDNRSSKDLLDTKKGGNKILKQAFEDLEKANRKAIPPFFYFVSDQGMSRKFIGLLVPGHQDISHGEQLEKTTIGIIDNYKANFTIVPCEYIYRKWLDDLLQGRGYDSVFAPAEWKAWVETGSFDQIDTNKLPEELDEHDSKHYIEGAKKTILVNAYERNPGARAECIRLYSYECYVCGFDSGITYGPGFGGLIHIHHIKPLHEIDEQYAVCPETDLKPVCPNCHMMLHSQAAKDQTLEELREKYHPKTKEVTHH